ncbi:hypothetical protein ALO_12591 [Acetonema longum DSM 6540]|uniref:Uncharacterized protein n=1 Tax=Acetonema longum DSM 6540 TaxID=1009370 RepID=F7NKA5_9FIRM|nr:hypothetical protein ALO_12591 [Acetonema longum DSM 6540]
MFNCPSEKECQRKCQLCGEHPGTHVIKNKINGTTLNICHVCLTELGIRKEADSDV